MRHFFARVDPCALKLACYHMKAANPTPTIVLLTRQRQQACGRLDSHESLVVSTSSAVCANKPASSSVLHSRGYTARGNVVTKLERSVRQAKTSLPTNGAPERGGLHALRLGPVIQIGHGRRVARKATLKSAAVRQSQHNLHPGEAVRDGNPTAATAPTLTWLTPGPMGGSGASADAFAALRAAS